MAERSADKIIDSLIHVTRQTDRELLEASLASTLYELMQVERVAHYKVFYEYNKPEFYLSAEVKNNKASITDAHKMLPSASGAETNNLLDCLQHKAAIFRHSGTGCQYLYPVINKQDAVTGIFSLQCKQPCCEDKQQFISGYFQIYSNYLRLLDESEHDTLTGLLNRRTFDSNLKKLLSQPHCEHDSHREDNPPQRRHENTAKSNWLAVIDIDFFKRINDHFGHLYGDEVLLLLANIMRESFRGYDKLFRFGGEEFVTILKTTNQDGATKALERFRLAVENYPFPQTGQVTVSIGYVELNELAIPSEILGYADEALYFAKQHGRNQVCHYETLISDGKLQSSTPAVASSDIEMF